ncbi:MAG: type II secretion system protein GspD [Deltaproteobacteria bacterium]|nr:type II secretion system protein GspD [Deltaproteobacteria bacterium]
MRPAFTHHARAGLFILIIFSLTACAPAVNSIQPQRYANIEPAKLKEVRTIEKQDSFTLLFVSDNTMRYKISRDDTSNLVTVDIPYTELPSPYEPPKITHPYVKGFDIKQSSTEPPLLQVKIQTAAGIGFRSSTTAGGDGLRIVLYPEKPDKEDIKPEGYYLYKLKYADSSQVAQLLKRLIPYGDSKIQVNEKENYLLLDTSFEGSQNMTKLLPEMDKPPYQILLEAEVLEVNVDDLKNLGISFSSPITTTLQEIQPINPPTYSTVDLPIQDIVRTPLSLVAAIHFLKENGKAKTLANPRVATTDGIEAKVVTAEKIPYFITEVQANYTYITKQEFTAGVELKIIPRVNEDGKITTKIATSISSITGTTPQGYPKTSSRNAETTLRIMAGQTIIIGGLLEDRVITTASGIPLFMDIPGIGRLFRTERVEKKQMELFIFITPYILEDGTV